LPFPDSVTQLRLPRFQEKKNFRRCDLNTSRKTILFSLFVISIFSTLFLAACSGPTLIDVNIDPTTGSGQIVVNPPPQATALPDTGAIPSSSTDMSQVALFAIVVILLLGVMAIVLSVARRPRRGDE
jgi:hypothetical protein